MRKILFSGPSPHLAGGIARSVGHLFKYYNKLGSDSRVDLELITIRNELVEYVRTDGFKNNLIRVITGCCKYITLCFDVKKKLTKKKYDVLHIATSASISLIKDICLVNIAKKRRTNSVIHFHFGRIPQLFILKNWEWKLIVKLVLIADSVIVIDQKSYKTLVDYGFKNVHYVPNPLSETIVDQVKKNENIQRNPRELVFVGQMLVSKGIYELIDACKQIPDIKLFMYGLIINDETRVKLIEHAGCNNGWLNVVGEIPYNEVVKKMMSASVFVLPTYTEGFPNVILESMACACPIVTTPVGAIPEMLDITSDNPCGICVEPKNIDQLRDAINLMLEDKDFASKCGDNARKKVMNSYVIDMVWKQMVEIWNK